MLSYQLKQVVSEPFINESKIAFVLINMVSKACIAFKFTFELVRLFEY